jgi:hypothetical protein
MARWEQLWMRYGVIPHGRQEMNPWLRLRLGHAKELSWHFLAGMLLHVGQDEEPRVGHRC